MHLNWRKIPINIASSVCISLRELHRAGSYNNQSLQAFNTFSGKGTVLPLAAFTHTMIVWPSA